MIHKTKIITAVVLCLAIVLTLCSCASKKAITSENFVSKAKELGYQTENITPNDSEYDYVVSSHCAQKQNVDEDHWFVMFLVAKTAQDAKEIFFNDRNDFANGSSSNVVETEANNNASYQGDKEGMYLFAAYVDNTVLCIEADLAYKDEAKKLIEALGY